MAYSLALNELTDEEWDSFQLPPPSSVLPSANLQLPDITCPSFEKATTVVIELGDGVQVLPGPAPHHACDGGASMGGSVQQQFQQAPNPPPQLMTSL